MGLRHFSTGSTECVCKTRVIEHERIVEKPVYVLPNPDPSNFILKKHTELGQYLVVWVNYPDCTNYEGNKILVFKGVSAAQIVKRKKIDPHFTTGTQAPIARFEPTQRGWKWALAFAGVAELVDAQR